jgi:hypothetical protein
MKSSIFWNITSFTLLEVNHRFGGTCRFHLQGIYSSKTLPIFKMIELFITTAVRTSNPYFT